MKSSFIFLSLMILTACTLQAQEKAAVSTTTSAQQQVLQNDTLVELATSFLGVPYKYGGITPEQGFDCSGFVKFIFSSFGLDLPRTTGELAHLGREIPVDSCRKGDIIIFSGYNKLKRPIGHAGIVVSDFNEPLKFIHSATSNNRGIVITAFDAFDYYKSRFVKVVRVLNPWIKEQKEH